MLFNGQYWHTGLLFLRIPVVTASMAESCAAERKSRKAWKKKKKCLWVRKREDEWNDKEFEPGHWNLWPGMSANLLARCLFLFLSVSLSPCFILFLSLSFFTFLSLSLSQCPAFNVPFLSFRRYSYSIEIRSTSLLYYKSMHIYIIFALSFRFRFNP